MEFCNELTHTFGFIVKPIIDTSYLTIAVRHCLSLTSRPSPFRCLSGGLSPPVRCLARDLSPPVRCLQLAARIGIKSMLTLYGFIIVGSQSLAFAKRRLPHSLKALAIEAQEPNRQRPTLLSAALLSVASSLQSCIRMHNDA